MPTLSLPQAKVFNCSKRFRILVAGRRFGKTFLSISELLRGASWPGFTAWYVGPTYRQSKQIAWKKLKEIGHPVIKRANETDLSVELSTGGSIALRGADNYDSLRGVGLDGVVLDECADIAPEVWEEVLRPALSDRLGWALWIGTPKGYDHIYELYNKAVANPDWGAFKFTTLEGGNVPASEVADARATMDAKTFRQEYEASFEETSEGKVYYAFDRNRNVRPTAYDPRLPICLSMDFNISPMCWCIAQIHDYNAANSFLLTNVAKHRQLHVLDEICIKNIHIPDTLKEFVRRAEKYMLPGQPLQVRLYGDPAGHSRNHQASDTSYTLINKFFQLDPRFKVSMHIPTAHPAVRDRVNAVNSLIRSADETIRLFIAPHCVELIKDFEQVTWKSDVAGNSLGEMDKSKNDRTHISDALGYLVEREFPITAGGYGFSSKRIV